MPADSVERGSSVSGLDGAPIGDATDDAPDASHSVADPPESADEPEPTPAAKVRRVGKSGGSSPLRSDSTSTDTDSESSRRGVGTVVLAVVAAALAVVAGVAVVRAFDYRDDYRQLQSQQADAQRAQDVASDYAVKAALIDYRNFDPWFAALRAGVDDAMRKQFTTTEPVLRQLLGQLQWNSKGTLVGSDIKSHNGSKYVVQVFVDVAVTNVQSPGGVKTTALYPITVDKDKNYAITDISGGVAPLATN